MDTDRLNVACVLTREGIVDGGGMEEVGESGMRLSWGGWDTLGVVGSSTSDSEGSEESGGGSGGVMERLAGGGIGKKMVPPESFRVCARPIIRCVVPH